MAQFKFGDFEFPDELIKHDADDVAPNQRQTIDSYTDMNGLTHMFDAPHTKTQIEFTTISMSADKMRAIMHGITSNYISPGKRDLICTYFDDEYGVTKTGHFYLDQNLKFPRKKVAKDGTPLKYGEMKWLFIEL